MRLSAVINRARIAFILALTIGGLLGQRDVQYEYDAQGQLTKAIYSDGLTVEYSYDAAGNLRSRRSMRSGSNVYFPFYQAGPGTFVGFAFSNYSTQPAELEFTAFNRSGYLLGTQQNPSTYSLPAGTQKALLGNEIFRIQSGQEKAGWIELLTDNEKVGTFFLFGDLGLTRLDGAPASLEPSPVLYFSRIYEGATAYRGQPAKTSLSLANPNDMAVQVELSLYAKNRANSDDVSVSLSAQKSVVLPPKGYLYGSVSELFERSSISGGYVKAEVAGVGASRAPTSPSATGIVGFELVELLSVPTVMGLAATGPHIGAGVYYAPQLAESPDIYSNLTVINTSTSDQWASLYFFEGCRSECGYNDKQFSSVPIALKPGEILSGDVREILGLDPTANPSLNGFLQVDASKSAVVDLIFGDPVGHRYAAAFPLQRTPYLKAVLSHVANSSNFFTGLAFLNMRGTASVRVRVRGTDGTLIGESSFEMENNQRVTKLVTQLIPEAADHIGGFIEVESNVSIFVQQIFGEMNLNMFSSIPPTVVD